jgi:hypothetical protein
VVPAGAVVEGVVVVVAEAVEVPRLSLRPTGTRVSSLPVARRTAWSLATWCLVCQCMVRSVSAQR